MRRRSLLAAGGAATGALLAGCTGFARRGSADERGVRTDTVTIPERWTYEPRVAEVTRGTTVTWVNEGSHPHTVTFRPDAPAAFDADLPPDERVRYTFEETGRFDYYCRYHQPDMVGAVVVV